MKRFMDEDFLLHSEFAEDLYHEYAEKLPILDYHTHIPVRDIAENRVYHNLTEVLVDNPVARQSAEAALAYIDLKPGQKLIGTPIDIVFIGSCTNVRLEVFREAARVAKGRKVAPGVQALAVPGSMAVREMAEAEGIAKILSDAGFEWRLPGCSMCLAMNDDRAEEGSRVASTSNRNFVGRQDKGWGTHLMSPASAAAAAIAGAIADPRDYL